MIDNRAEHPLRSVWLISYLPSVTPEMVKEAGDDFDAAQQQALRTGGPIETLEQLWSSMMSLPPYSDLPTNDSYVFARDGVNPSYSSFPNGGKRVNLFSNGIDERETKFLVEMALGAVLGEACTAASEGNSVVDVVRVVHKCSRSTPRGLQIQLWHHRPELNGALVDYFKRVCREACFHQLADKGVVGAEMK